MARWPINDDDGDGDGDGDDDDDGGVSEVEGRGSRVGKVAD